MADIYFDELLKKIPNKYLLTILTGKRAREIVLDPEEIKKLREDGNFKTVAQKTLEEVIEGKIAFDIEKNKELL